jgi:hypothetical protein
MALASAIKGGQDSTGDAPAADDPASKPILIEAQALEPIMPIVSLPAPNVGEQQTTRLPIPDGAPEPPQRVVEPTPAPAVRPKPVSLFVSLKDRRLYVRQGTQPLFDVPIVIAHPDEPIGTHVFTAMGPKDGGGLRWTVVSIPSHPKRAAEPAGDRPHRKGHRTGRAASTQTMAPTVPSAASALDRVVLPRAAMERIAGSVLPGSSLIVSDNQLSGETSNATEFIVLTR